MTKLGRLALSKQAAQKREPLECLAELDFTPYMRRCEARHVCCIPAGHKASGESDVHECECGVEWDAD